MKNKYWLLFGIVGLVIGIIASIFISIAYTGPESIYFAYIMLCISATLFGIIFGGIIDLLFYIITKKSLNLSSWENGALIGFVLSFLGSICVSLPYFQDLGGIFILPIALTFSILEVGTPLWAHLLHIFIYTFIGSLLGLIIGKFKKR